MTRARKSAHRVAIVPCRGDFACEARLLCETTPAQLIEARRRQTNVNVPDGVPVLPISLAEGDASAGRPIISPLSRVRKTHSAPGPICSQKTKLATSASVCTGHGDNEQAVTMSRGVFWRPGDSTCISRKQSMSRHSISSPAHEPCQRAASCASAGRQEASPGRLIMFPRRQRGEVRRAWAGRLCATRSDKHKRVVFFLLPPRHERRG